MGGLASCFAFSFAQCAVCMGCSCLASILNFTLSQASRLGHILIIFTVFTLAIVLGISYPDKVNSYNSYTKVNLSEGCAADNLNECIYRQLIYRASFSLVLLFSLLAIFSYFFEYPNKSLWIIKFLLGIGVFIGFWWADNEVFNGWAEVARVLSFLWLLIQGLLFLDFAHDSHDMLMAAADDSERTSGNARFVYGSYVFLSVLFLACAGVGLGYLFKDYTNCQLGMFFTVLTLLMGIILTIISLLNTVSKGLLTPCLMFAYSVFLAWYALLSSPDQQCNPYANVNWGAEKTTAVVIVATISLLVLTYSVVNGTRILNVFNPEGEGVIQSYGSPSQSRELKEILTGEGSALGTNTAINHTSNFSNNNPQHDKNGVTQREPGTDPPPSVFPGGSDSTDEARTQASNSSGSAHERVFFHILMILFCSYAAMIMTSWGNTKGSPESHDTLRATESMWLKIVSQWVFLLLYVKVLHVSFLKNSD